MTDGRTAAADGGHSISKFEWTRQGKTGRMYEFVFIFYAENNTKNRKNSGRLIALVVGDPKDSQ